MFFTTTLITATINTSKPSTFARDARIEEMGTIDRFMTKVCKFFRLI
jgi:hypothetical protein